jgi:hypothetical protein
MVAVAITALPFTAGPSWDGLAVDSELCGRRTILSLGLPLRCCTALLLLLLGKLLCLFGSLALFLIFKRSFAETGTILACRAGKWGSIVGGLIGGRCSRNVTPARLSKVAQGIWSIAIGVDMRSPTFILSLEM